MQKFSNVMQDTLGNALPGVTISVYPAGTLSLATIYSSNAFAAQANPFVTGTDGAVVFYAPDGRYDITPTKSGYTFNSTETNDILFDDPDSVISPAQITANQNDYAPTNALYNRTWLLTSDTSGRTITGIGAGFGGQTINLLNTGGFGIILSNQSVSSSAVNRIITGAGADITLAAGAQIFLVYDSVASRWRAELFQQSIAPTGQIFGLTLSNNAGSPTTKIDIAVGEASSDDGAGQAHTLMYLSAVLTKDLTSTWVVGNGNGGLDTGAVGNNTYHVFLIERLDTGVVDALFSLSATSPTMPTNYTKKRRIGSIVRSSGSIVLFTQHGDVFLRGTPVQDANVYNPGTSLQTVTLSVPTGISVQALITNGGYVVTTTWLYTHSLDVADVAAAASNATAPYLSTLPAYIPFSVWTNTSGQIGYRVGASDANTNIFISTFGWIDPRGRTS